MRAFGHGARTRHILVLLGTLSFLTGTDGFDFFATTGAPLVERATQNTTTPAPIVASVSQYWEGNDGTWSSFAIQVGQKSQNVRVLPSTASSSTWVVYDQGCPSDAPSNCKESRGGIFNPNNSLTWVPNSIFELGIEENLDVNVFGDFGFDTVTLGWQGSGGPSVEHSILAGIGDTAFSWLGALGLNPRPTNFTSLPNSPQVSFIQALRNKNQIPSVSWAYTAGASYRLNKVFGSLVIGGYDKSRFTTPSTASPNLTFPFYTDISRDLLVGISSITASNTTTSTSSATLLKDGIFALIDSTVPHLWLPESVCTAFESAFGLIWNSNTSQYTLNSTQHTTLKTLNPSITITLSPQLPPTSPSNSISITLPYSAFDLNISWPHAESSTYYFPLKRATNETQYTLGRTFLQEAYLIADYERSNFSVWPCSWDSGTTSANIIPIRSVSDNSTTPNGNENGGSKKKGLAAGAIAGIAIGALAILILLLALLFFHRRRRRTRSHELPAHNGSSTALQDLPPGSYQLKDSSSQTELDSRTRHELNGHNNKFGLLEAPDGVKKFEMDGTATPVEKDGREAFGNGREVHEMDADTERRVDQRREDIEVFVQPPTAVGTGPEKVFPSPTTMKRR
ncbi:aspartic peptidase domain-containing protein [Clohesyomyces aquaticus]|uniref:Aspartic peptidase domain-containing protein n=1 Tax=Clohesyomyces aquaticus TaxID=1231657 RepID=A0A1Y2AAJ0_9PLEO|nr:aspartic peptidase domain-containing protein [Clohesyomyces aquaticus]